MEINYRQKRLTMLEKMRIATDYNANMPIEDIMQKYAIRSRTTVYNALNAVVKRKEEHANS